MRPPPFFLPVIALASVFCTAAQAFGSIDPFNTEALAPPRPLLTPAADTGQAVCQTLPAETIYGVLEVVDQALCRNPKTYEAWASARAQAA